MKCSYCFAQAGFLVDTGAFRTVPGTTYGIQLVRTTRPLCQLHLMRGIAKGWPFDVLVGLPD